MQERRKIFGEDKIKKSVEEEKEEGVTIRLSYKPGLTMENTRIPYLARYFN